MPKLKSHKGASKRFKKTAKGKVKRGHAKLRHILTSKEHKKTQAAQGDAGERWRSGESLTDDSVSVM